MEYKNLIPVTVSRKDSTQFIIRVAERFILWRRNKRRTISLSISQNAPPPCQRSRRVHRLIASFLRRGITSGGGKPSVCFLFASVISRSRFISTNVSKYSRGPCESVILCLNLPKRFKIHSVKPSQSLDGRWWWRCWRLKVLVLVFWFRSSPSSCPPLLRLSVSVHLMPVGKRVERR